MQTAHQSNPFPIVGRLDPSRRRTRWRIVVVTLLVAFGIIYLIATPIPLIVAYKRPVEFGGGITLSRIVGVLLVAIDGILWIASGAMCWRGRWLFAFIGVSVGCLAGLRTTGCWQT